jgi:hypothetical protein
MMTLDNQIYRDTELLKLGIKKLKSPFLELAKWISSKYMVEVLNITHDLAIPDSRPRLGIILNTNNDVLQFESSFGKGSIVKKEMREQFEDLLKKENSNKYQTEFLFVIFSSFERAARIRATENITEGEIEGLKSKVAKKTIWEISKFGDSITFFYYTERQIKTNEASGLNKVLVKEYLKILQRHDKHGYFKYSNPPVYFDSKENFDKSYNGSWFYYYR